jgi:hypothetical protein
VEVNASGRTRSHWAEKGLQIIVAGLHGRRIHQIIMYGPNDAYIDVRSKKIAIDILFRLSIHIRFLSLLIYLLQLLPEDI